jgi:Amidohydrolase family
VHGVFFRRCWRSNSTALVTQLWRLLPRNPLFLTPCGHFNTRQIFLESDSIVFPDGVAPGALHLKRGRIFRIYRQPEVTAGEIKAVARTVDNLGGIVMDVGKLTVSPGVIDVHTHFNEPGRKDWEGLTTGTTAAATGGVTTVVDMPLNCNPTITTLQLLKKKIRAVRVRAPSVGCLQCMQHMHVACTAALRRVPHMAARQRSVCAEPGASGGRDVGGPHERKRS